MKKDLNKPIKLKVKAVDNSGNKYPVSLERGELGVVLSINGTPGSWYMNSLLCLDQLPAKGSADARLELNNELAIDFGAKWYCVNMKAIMKSALIALCS